MQRSNCWHQQPFAICLKVADAMLWSAACYILQISLQVKMLLTDQKVAVQQIPFLSRIVALLGPIFPDITSLCMAGLEADFAKLLVRCNHSTSQAKLHLSSFLACIRSAHAALYWASMPLPWGILGFTLKGQWTFQAFAARRVSFRCLGYSNERKAIALSCIYKAPLTQNLPSKPIDQSVLSIKAKMIGP